MDWYSLRPSSSISVCYFTLANPAHYAVILSCSCSCLLLFFFFFFSLLIFRIPIAVLRPYMSSFFFLFTLCLYTLELTLAYVWWDGVVSFLYSFYPHALSYICIYVMVKSCYLKHIKRRTSILSTKMQHEQSPCILSTSHHQWISIPGQKALHQYSPTWIPPFPQQRQPKAQEPIHHLLTSQQTILPGRLCQLQWQAIQSFLQHLYRTNESCF